MFPWFDFQPSRDTFIGVVLGVLIVALLRATLHA